MINGQLEQFKAEIIVGITTFGIKKSEALKLIDNFEIFINKIKLQYSFIDKFYLKLGNFVYTLNDYYLEKLSENDILKIKCKDLMGIVRRYPTFSFIGESEINTKLKNQLELEKINKIFESFGIRDINITNPKNTLKEIKKCLKEKYNNFVGNRSLDNGEMINLIILPSLPLG